MATPRKAFAQPRYDSQTSKDIHHKVVTNRSSPRLEKMPNREKMTNR